MSNVVIKPLIGRRRPDPERTSIARRIGHLPWTSSFPSGHSASAAAFAAGATMELPVAGPFLAPLAAAVAYSRVHVGVHYRSDVWAGAAVGLTVAVVGRALWPVKPWGPALMAAGTAPALPGGEGLTVIVNQASGTSDGSAESIRTALPDAKVLEWDPATDLAALIDGDPQALGRCRRRRHRRLGRADRATTGACRSRSSRPARSTISPRPSAWTPTRTPSPRSSRAWPAWSTWPSSTVSAS